MANLDAIDLKREIRILREKRGELEAEKLSLLRELEGLEAKEKTLKQEYNVVGAVSDLNHAERFASSSSSATEANDTEFEKKFKETNKKLEIKILTQQIKAILPKLEAEALLWESRIHEYESSAQSIEDDFNQLPGHILKTAEHFEEEIGALLEERMAQKAQLGQDMERLKQEKKALTEEIKGQRLQINAVDGDIWVMMAASLKARAKFEEEELKIRELTEEQILLREEICKFYNDASNGWMTEAFVMNAGSTSGSLAMDEVPAVMAQWLPAYADTSEENVWDAFRACQIREDDDDGGDDKSPSKVNLALFSDMCHYIISETSMSGR